MTRGSSFPSWIPPRKDQGWRRGKIEHALATRTHASRWHHTAALYHHWRQALAEAEAENTVADPSPSLVNVPMREEVCPANQAIFDQFQGMIGFVPNLYATLAHSDQALVRFLAYQNAPSSLQRKEKEAVNLVVSQVNGCRYGLSAHLVLGKLCGFDDAQLHQIRQGRSDDPRLHALVALAADITTRRGHASAEAVAAFFAQGYTRQNLVDLILQVSEKTTMNYLHNLTQVPVDFPDAPPL